MAVARRQRVGRALIQNKHGFPCSIYVRRDSRRERIRQIYQSPTFEVNVVLDLKIVSTRRARAIDKHGFEQRRAGRRLKCVREVILDQRQHTGHVRRRHAGAGFITVIRPRPGAGRVNLADGLVQIAQHQKIIAGVVGCDGVEDDVEIDGFTGDVADGKIETVKGFTAEYGGDGQAAVRRDRNLVNGRVRVGRGTHQSEINRQIGEWNRRTRVGEQLDGDLNGIDWHPREVARPQRIRLNDHG